MTERSKNRRGLGRGLGALIPDAPQKPVDVLIPDREGSGSGGLDGGSARDLLGPRKPVSRETVSRETSEDLLSVPGARFAALPVDEIEANSQQPRTVFEHDELEQLAESIKQVGVLQPIVVREVSEGHYELVMGERRLRATIMAGLKTIPAIIREVGQEDLLRDALLENLHRVQLNPLEEAAAYQQLLSDFGCTQEELSARIARSRPQIANTLRLLKLPGGVQQRVAAGVLSAGHARALVSIDDPVQAEALAQRIVNEGLSVRATEDLVRMIKDGPRQRKSSSKPEPSGFAVRTASTLADRLETTVTINEGKNRGKIVITFADADDLARIAEILTGSD